MTDTCPCGKQKPFAECCGRFLSGQQIPKTPEQLMRSRYSAYVLGGYGEYLLQSWFPATATGVTAEELSDRNVNWQRLEVIDKSQNNDEAAVEFKAYYLPENSDELKAMHEKSEFRRVNGRWFYVGGRVE